MRLFKGPLVLIVVFAAAMLLGQDSSAVPDTEARQLRDDGVTAWENGEFDLARRHFGEAGARAQQMKDWEVLLMLSEDYFILVPDDAGHENDNLQAARETFVWATSTCYDLATYSSQRSGSGQNCPDGLQGCRAVVEKFDNVFSELPASPTRDALEAQANIARRVTCQPDPGTGPVPQPTPTATPGAHPVFDRRFGQAQYFVHSIKHSSTGGDVSESVYFCFPGKPDERGVLVLPDGSGGTYWRQTDYAGGPFNTPREVCADARSRGVGNATYNGWNANWYFDCSQLP